ncbi:hypothetical protein QN277_020396 [Acacia crassicarpa]|uniref:Uncharacterized protein n=1 Tax=Acacia crassicarpa TaxID=499986 RepID=A0AAE1JP13_9FABA|nr:hypothetical protein QN277_020396 [Acacia crassicarpa]
MAFSHPISIASILLPILLLLASLFQPSHGFSLHGRGMPDDNSTRRLFGSRAGQRLNCGDLAVLSQCSQNSKCSWCRSEVLDDMCFSRTEAWRLPPEVFSCG